MKYFITLSVLILPFFGLKSLPTTQTLPEKEYYQYVQAVRTRKFSDREIDRLHQALALKLEEIKNQIDAKTIKNKAQYNQLLPETEEVLFLKDKDGKEYYSLFLGQGISIDNYPTENIVNSRAYIYLSEDKKSLSKVILQYVKVNSSGTRNIKEMRRIVNNNPIFPGPPKIEGEKVNGDLPKAQEPYTVDPGIAPQEIGEMVVEYYSGHDSNIPWVEESPSTEAKVSISQKLHDDKDLLPFDAQKKVYISYRDALRELDSRMGKKLHNVILDRKATIKKLTDFN